MKYILNQQVLYQALSKKIESLFEEISTLTLSENSSVMEDYKMNLSQEDLEKITNGESNADLDEKKEKLNSIIKAVEDGILKVDVVDVDLMKKHLLFSDEELLKILQNGKEESL